MRARNFVVLPDEVMPCQVAKGGGLAKVGTEKGKD